MVGFAYPGVSLFAAAVVLGTAVPGAAQVAPPKEVILQAYPKGGTYAPISTASPRPKPIPIPPGGVVISYPDGSAAIQNPLLSQELPADTVPFTLTANGQILLTAHVGAHILHLVLDTGASSTGLLPVSAAKLDLRPDPKATAVPNVKFGVLPEIALDRILLKKVPVAVTEMSALKTWNGDHPDQTIDGVLGIDTLQQWAIGLDMLAQTVTFWKGGHVRPEQILVFQFTGLQRYGRLPAHPEPIRLPLAVTIPMHHKAADADHPFYALPVRIDDVEVEMDLDTGALISTLPDKIAAKLKPLVTSKAAVRTLNGDFAITAMVLRAMWIGSLKRDFPFVATQPPGASAEFAVATLGRPFFDRCQVVLDFPASTLSAARLIEPTDDRLLLSALGVFPRALGKRLTALVQSGSAAAEAGILKEDEIVNIETAYKGSKASLQTDAPVPRDITLTIRRGGRAAPLKFSFRVLRITETLAGQRIVLPDGGRVYLFGSSGGVTVQPGVAVVPPVDALLLFDSNAAEPSKTKP